MAILRKWDFTSLFFKSYCDVDVFEQTIYTNMYQLFIFIQTFSKYQRDDIDVSNEVIILQALQCTIVKTSLL